MEALEAEAADADQAAADERRRRARRRSCTTWASRRRRDGSSSSSARVAGLTAEVAEEYAREKPMRIKFQVEYDGPPLHVRSSETPWPPNDHRGRNRTSSTQLVGRARAAMRAIEDYDQATVDRICRAVAWAGGNETTATRLANMSVDESGMGRREPTRRAKVQGILRDALRQKSMGIIEEDPGSRPREVREARRRHRRRSSRSPAPTSRRSASRSTPSSARTPWSSRRIPRAGRRRSRRCGSCARR